MLSYKDHKITRFLVLATLCLVAPLAAEALRRFIFYSNIIYVGADLFTFLITARLIYKTRYRIDQILLFLILAYLFIGFIGLIVYGNSPIFVYLGFRPILYFLCWYYVGQIIVSLDNDFDLHISNLYFFAACAVTLVAVIQIYLGREHPINQLPDEVYSEGAGIGDYSDQGRIIEWLFRPTSFFMHTGRFGQFIFFAALFSVFYGVRRSSKILIVIFLISVTGILVSGQRSALVFFSGALTVWVLAYRSSWLVYIVVIAIFLIGLLFLIPEDVISVVLGRGGSGFTSAWDRIREETGALSGTLNQYFLIGRGIGYFSFGSRSFGGEVFYEHVEKYGGGENAWLRIIGEVGVPGLLVVLLIGLYLIVPVMRRMRSSNKADVHIQYIAFSAVVSGCLWSFTHDFFGNYLSLGLVGLAIGVARASL